MAALNLGDHIPSGRVEYDEIINSTHPWYGAPCPMCDRLFRLGHILVTFYGAGQISGGFSMCGRCVDLVARSRPPEFDEQKIERLREGSPLVQWVEASG